MKRVTITAVAALFFCLAVCQPGQAQLKSLFKKSVEADKSKTYWLSDREGPWLIMCASFGGENGIYQANDLVMELREKHNLKAYVYKKKFDYSGKIRGVGWSRYSNEENPSVPKAREMQAVHSEKIEEIAVVIGDFSSLEDRKAQDTLKKVKYLRPEALRVDPNTPTSQRMGVLRELQRRVSRGELRQMGPMRKAFLIPNPMIPEDFFNQNQVDKFVLKLNKDIENSLLDCPGNYSVRVATFRGESTFKLKEIAEKQKEQNRFMKLRRSITNSKLAEAEEKARRLTKELRKLGVEAYEFHDRYESYVCVGSFDYANYKNQQGREIWNQDIIKVMQDYKGTVENFPNIPNAVRPKTLPSLRGTGIAFDVQPVPVKVPRAQVGKSRR